MRLKLFRAPDMAGALAAVRAELGQDALILSTRRAAGGVEIAATIQPDDEDEPPPLLEPAAPPSADPALAALLAYHAIPPPLGQRLHGPLTEALARTFAFASLPLTAGARPLLFAGPPGAGKTLTVARVATRLVMQGTTPTVITADGRRAGAAEQLAAFTRLLGLNLIVANQPATLGRALVRRAGGAPVLIDAPGADPFDPAQREELEALAATADASVALVLPAGLDPAEAAEFGERFAAAGATLLVATRLDVSRRLGSVLAAAHAGSLALAEAGIGPGAADGLAPLTPALLAERLLAPIQPDRPT